MYDEDKHFSDPRHIGSNQLAESHPAEKILNQFDRLVAQHRSALSELRQTEYEFQQIDERLEKARAIFRESTEAMNEFINPTTINAPMKPRDIDAPWNG